MVWPQLKICWSYSYSWSWCCCCWELQSSLILIMATWQKLGLLAHKIFFCKQPDHNLTTICRQFHDDRLQSDWQLYKSWIKKWPQLYGSFLADQLQLDIDGLRIITCSQLCPNQFDFHFSSEVWFIYVRFQPHMNE